MQSLLTRWLTGCAVTVGLGTLAASVDAPPQVPPQVIAANGTNVDAVLLAGLKWRSIGPARGGRSIAVAGSTSRPSEFYFGATGGGLWKTTDAGLTWRPVSDRFFKTSSVGAVAVAESNPD